MAMRLRLSLVFLFALSLAGAANAQVVELTDHDAPRRQQWENLSVTLPSGVSSTATISLQDARGGLTVARAASDAFMDPGTGQSTIIIALPYLAETELPANKWPLVCTISGAKPALREVRRPAPAADRSTLRVIRPAKAADMRVPQGLSTLPTIVTAMPDEEILTGPLLLFASADMVLLSGDLAGKLSEERAADLMAAGVQLVIAENSEEAVPMKSALARFAWSRVSASSFAGWITPARPLSRPQVLEAYLGDAPALNPRVVPSPALKRSLVITPLACVVLLILAWGLFRHPATILAACAVAFLGAAVIFVAYARGVSPPMTSAVMWKASSSDLDGPTGGAGSGALVLTESFTALQPLFTYQALATRDQGTLLYPVFSSSRQYFAMKEARLDLLDSTENRLDAGSHFEVTLKPRTQLVFASRSASLEAAFTRQALTAANGWWLSEGYVYADADARRNGVLITEWVNAHPPIAASLLTWFNLRRFTPDHRYVILEQRTTPMLIDLGPRPASTAAP